MVTKGCRTVAMGLLLWCWIIFVFYPTCVWFGPCLHFHCDVRPFLSSARFFFSGVSVCGGRGVCAAFFGVVEDDVKDCVLL